MNQISHGMDVAGVRTLASQFEAKASEIEGIANQLTSQLGGTAWVGPDATTFRNDWDGQYRSYLRQVADALRTAQANALRNADQQESASA